MQKVVYSISKVNKDEKLKGVGYLVEGNLHYFLDCLRKHKGITESVVPFDNPFLHIFVQRYSFGKYPLDCFCRTVCRKPHFYKLQKRLFNLKKLF